MLQFRLCTLSACLCMLSARLCTLSLFVFSELCHGQFHKVPSFEILPGFVLAAERPKSFKTDFPSCCLVFGLLSLWASVLLSLSGGAHASIRTSPALLLLICLFLVVVARFVQFCGPKPNPSKRTSLALPLLVCLAVLLALSGGPSWGLSRENLSERASLAVLLFSCSFLRGLLCSFLSLVLRLGPTPPTPKPSKAIMSQMRGK